MTRQNLMEKIPGFDSRNWDNILNLDKENISKAMKNFLHNIQNLLEKHLPLKN